MREILLHGGFDPTEAWIDFAVQGGFTEIRSRRISGCPDCGSSDLRPFGRFVYYSHLVNVRQCRSCDLISTDVRLDAATIEQHFETAYKDEIYFSVQRAPIFDHLAKQVDRVAPIGGSVLDIGGANGHLMSRVRARRPDLRITVNDLSPVAVANAARQFGFETILGGIHEIRKSGRSFDVVVASDVLYYEPDLSIFWATIGSAVAPGAAVIVRVPNKLVWIRCGRVFDRLRASIRRSALETSVRFMNPEHLYVLSRRYLLRRFEKSGFDPPVFLPSPLLQRGRLGSLATIYLAMANPLARWTGGRVLLTPGMLVLARRSKRAASNPRLPGGPARAGVVSAVGGAGSPGPP